jgi:hypothetical protein
MHTITMTAKGNAKYKGKKYKAVTSKDGLCGPCAFFKTDCYGALCEKSYHISGKAVYFVRKPKKEKAT